MLLDVYFTKKNMQNVFDNIPDNTILFVDQRSSIVISLMNGFLDLLSNKFLMICNLVEFDEISALINKLKSIFKFRNAAIMVSKPIRNCEVLMNIFKQNEIDVYKIFSANPENDNELFVKLPNFDIKIWDNFILIPTMPNINLELLGIEEPHSCSLIAESIIEYMELNNQNDFLTFSYGEYSENVQKILELKQKRNVSDNALLLIDRNKFCAPLFMNESLLDNVSSNFTSFIKDKEFVEIALNKGDDELLRKIVNLFSIKDKKISYQKLYDYWNSLTLEEKYQYEVIHPSLKFIFSEAFDNELFQMKENILDGKDVNDIMNNIIYNFSKSLSLIGIEHCIKEIDYEFLVSKAYNNCSCGKEKMLPINSIIKIFSSCSSGYKFQDSKKFKIKDLYCLPYMLKRILNKDSQIDENIKSYNCGFFSKLFSKKKSLCDFKNLFVYILGGISFTELQMINSILKDNDSDINFKIISDSFCSPRTIFSNLN